MKYVEHYLRLLYSVIEIIEDGNADGNADDNSDDETDKIVDSDIVVHCCLQFSHSAHTPTMAVPDTQAIPMQAKIASNIDVPPLIKVPVKPTYGQF